jgi:hypothetical protein
MRKTVKSAESLAISRIFFEKRKQPRTQKTRLISDLSLPLHIKFGIIMTDCRRSADSGSGYNLIVL